MQTMDDFADLPTVMGLEQEARVMRALMEMPVSHLAKNKAQFKSLLENLSLSFHDDLLGMKEEGEKPFSEFADWLDQVIPETDVELDTDFGDMFRFSYADLVRDYQVLALPKAEQERVGAFVHEYFATRNAVNEVSSFLPHISNADEYEAAGQMGDAAVELAKALTESRLNSKRKGVTVPSSVINSIVKLATEFGKGGQLPREFGVLFRTE
jgi:hypothetical protein